MPASPPKYNMSNNKQKSSHAYETWRKQKQSLYDCGDLTHFHRVSDCLLRDVSNLLRYLLRHYVDAGTRPLTLCLDYNQANSIFLFLDEMQCAYLHPRSTSARIMYAASETSPRVAVHC